MLETPHWTRALPALALAAALHAQNPSAEDPLAGTALTRADWLVPIHRVDERDEHQAAGADFKVGFDAGVEFHPVLGNSAPRNLPLRWTTKSLRFDGPAPIELAHGSPERDAAPRRYALRYGAVTEVYDLLEEGVEQSFVFASPKANGVDLVVAGEITTELHAPAIEPRHGPLEFHTAGGEPVVSYGAAFAIDAAGRKLPLATRFDGREIELRVPAAWLEDARWPVTVDPLLARVQAGGGAFVTGASEQPAMLWDGRNSRYLLAFLRAVSGGDRDLYVRTLDADLQDLGLVTSDLAAWYDVRTCAVAFAQAADRYVIASERFNPGNGLARVALHVVDADQLNQIYVAYDEPGPGIVDTDPSLGGTTTGGTIYLAMRRDTGLGNTSSSRVLGRVFDPLGINSTGFVEHRSSNSLVDYDAEAPSVSTASDGSGWVVVWQERNALNANDDWDVIGQRVSAAGTPGAIAVFGQGGDASLHKFAPSVAGTTGNYAVAYLVRPNNGTADLGTGLGREVRAQTFDWVTLAGQPTFRGSSTVASLPLPADLFALGGGTSVAFDTSTDSHWAVVWRRAGQNRLFAARLGFDAGIAEQVEVEPTPPSGEYGIPSVCHHPGRYEFVVCYGQDIQFSQNPVSMRQLVTDSTSAAQAGTGCLGGVQLQNHGTRKLPYRGSRYFGVRLVGGKPQIPTWLLVGPGLSTQPLPLPLPPICPLLLDPTLPVITAGQGISDATGGMTVHLPIPSATGALTLYWQFVQLDVVEATTSDAWQTVVGG